MTTTYEDAVNAQETTMWFDGDCDCFVCLIQWPNGDYHELRIGREEVANQWEHYPHEN